MTSLITGRGEPVSSGPGVKGVAPDAHVLYYAGTIDTGESTDVTTICLGTGGEDLGIGGVSAEMGDAIDAGADVI